MSYDHRPGFLKGLHVLRGMAAVAIVAFHLIFFMDDFPVEYLGILRDAGTAVQLFFVLSCFSLCHSTYPKLDRVNWLGGYAIRRLARIYPLFLLMLIFQTSFSHFYIGHSYPLGKVLLNASLLYQFIPFQHAGIVWASWTIGVEVTFYCLFPLLIATIRRPIAWAVLLVLAVLVSLTLPTGSLVGNSAQYGYMCFPRQLFNFVLGGFVYTLAMHPRIGGRRGIRLASLVVALAMFAVWGLQLERVIDVVPQPLLSVFKGTTIACFILYFFDKPYGFNRLTNFWGNASYSIYLIHPVVLFLAKPHLAWLYETSLPPDVCFAIAFVVVLAITSLVALVVNRWFESPVYRLGVRLACKVEGQKGEDSGKDSGLAEDQEQAAAKLAETPTPCSTGSSGRIRPRRAA